VRVLLSEVDGRDAVVIGGGDAVAAEVS